MTQPPVVDHNKLKQIRDRADNATVGPWEGDRRHVFIGAGHWRNTNMDLNSRANDLNDAEFIAQAREDIPELLNTVDVLLAHIDYLCAEVQRLSLIVALHSPTQSDPLRPPYIVTCETEVRP